MDSKKERRVRSRSKSRIRAPVKPNKRRSKSQAPRNAKKKKTQLPVRPWRTGSPVGPPPVISTSDARVASSQSAPLSLANQLKTITIDKNFPLANLIWIANGYLSKALERGFAGGASGNLIPYYAHIFMVNLMANYVQNQVVPVTTMPYWLLCLCHAISPKSVRFGHGSVNYTFAIGDSLPYSPTSFTFVAGATVFGSKYTLGPSGGSPVDGFPTVPVYSSVYTDQLGANAFQQLVQFMKTDLGGARIVSSSDTTPFMTDVSAYAIFAQAEGTGINGTGGGIYGLLQLEVPILHPILALASCVEDTFIVAPVTRNFNWSMPIAGDPTFLGCLMSTVLSTRELSAKRTNRIKNIDFLEFGDTVAIWVQKIVQAYITDIQSSTGEIPIASRDACLCPITLQEMLLLLRNLMMGAFKDSQAAVQGILPFRPSGNTDNEFTPFVASATQCALNTLDMILPTPLIENIRALSARKVKFPASAHDILHYLPNLGQYYMDTLQSSDYQVNFTIGGVEVGVNVFKTGAIWEKTEMDSKGNYIKSDMVETAISLIDGTAGSTLVYINDPEQLKMRIDLWNGWFQNSGVNQFSCGAGTYGSELGINVLCSIAMTRTWTVFGGGYRRFDDKSAPKPILKKTTIVDKRFATTQKKYMLNTPYSFRKAVIDTSQGEILSAPYEQVLGTWILPCNDDEAIIGSESTVIQRYQFMMDEPHSITRTSGETGVSLSALHGVYASKMTRSKLAPTDDWSNFFVEMSRIGRGGILTGLVAGVVSAAFPALGGIAKTISDALPI